MSIILFRVVITISSVFVMISLGYANKNTTDTTPHKKEGYIKRTFYNILNLKKKNRM